MPKRKDGQAALTDVDSPPQDSFFLRGDYMKVTEAHLRDLSDKFIEAAISGNLDASRNLLTIVAHAINGNVTLPPKLRNYVANALASIAEGNDPAEALNMKRKRGQKETLRALERSVELAMAVCTFHRIERMTVAASVEKVAETLHASESSVRLAWNTHRSNLSIHKWEDGSETVGASWSYSAMTPRKKTK